MKPLLLINDHASRYAQLKPLMDHLPELDVRHPGSKEAMREAARDAAAGRVVIAAGGDGTIHDVLQGLHESDHVATLGVLPLGTGNDFARTLGMPLDLEAAADALCIGLATRRLDVMKVEADGETSVGMNVLNLGFAREVESQMDGQLKDKLGPFAYLVGGAKAASQAGWVVDVAIDDQPEERFEIAALAVCNGRTAGGGFELAFAADPEDGLLDVLVIPRLSPSQLAIVAGKARARRLTEEPELERRHARRVRIRVVDRCVGATLDGEPTDALHELRVRVVPNAQAVWVGPDYQRSPLEAQLV